MPVIDMPLAQLKTYQGINPRPADFDSYWESALAEMNAVDCKPELIPAEFTCSFANCYHLYYTGTGGARIYAKVILPKGKTQPSPAVLMFHGYTCDCGDFADKLHYAAAGYAVAAMDARGQGGRSEDVGGVLGNTLRGHVTRGLDNDTPDKLVFRNVFLDTALLAKIMMAMPEVDANDVSVTGGSQGGALSLVCAALCPSIKRAAVSYPFLSDYKRVWQMDLAKNAYEDLLTYFRKFDPMHEREDEIFTMLGYIDVQHFADRIKAQVLFFTGLVDTTCPPSTQFAIYNKITAPKELKIFPDYGHENLPMRNDMIFTFLTKT